MISVEGKIEKGMILALEPMDDAFCSSFIVMREHNISLAFTSDKHFEQAGFIRLLEI